MRTSISIVATVALAGAVVSFFAQDSSRIATAQDHGATAVFALAGGLAVRHAIAGISLRGWLLTFAAGFLTANGGGTVRDLAMGQSPFWLSDISYVLIPAAAALAIILQAERLSRLSQPIGMADELSTGIFLGIGVWKVVAVVPADSEFFVAAAMLSGVVTSLGGGMLRDALLLRNVPTAITTPALVNVVVCGALLAMLTGHQLIQAVGIDTIEELSCVSAALVLCAGTVSRRVRLFGHSRPMVRW